VSYKNLMLHQVRLLHIVNWNLFTNPRRISQLRRHLTMIIWLWNLMNPYQTKQLIKRM